MAHHGPHSFARELLRNPLILTMLPTVLGLASLPLALGLLG